MPLTNIFTHTTQFEVYKAGETIFANTVHGDSMYIVIEGQVDLCVDNHLLETVGAVGIIGELALIEPDQQRGLTALARTDCKVVALDAEHFICFVQHTPHFALEVMRVMATRLRRWSLAM